MIGHRIKIFLNYTFLVASRISEIGGFPRYDVISAGNPRWETPNTTFPALKCEVGRAASGRVDNQQESSLKQ